MFRFILNTYSLVSQIYDHTVYVFLCCTVSILFYYKKVCLYSYFYDLYKLHLFRDHFVRDHKNVLLCISRIFKEPFLLKERYSCPQQAPTLSTHESKQNSSNTMSKWYIQYSAIYFTILHHISNKCNWSKNIHIILCCISIG